MFVKLLQEYTLENLESAINNIIKAEGDNGKAVDVRISQTDRGFVAVVTFKYEPKPKAKATKEATPTL